VITIFKDEQRRLLGRSPDLADMLMMRMALLLQPQPQVD